MKIKKLTTSIVGSTAETVFGIALGAMLSNGVSKAIPVDNKTLVKAGVAVAGIIGASVIGGDDMLSKLARNASIGMAGQQGKELIVENIQPMLPAATGTGANKFLHDVFESDSPVAIDQGMGNAWDPQFLANGYQDEPLRVNSGFASA